MIRVRSRTASPAPSIHFRGALSDQASASQWAALQNPLRTLFMQRLSAPTGRLHSRSSSHPITCDMAIRPQVTCEAHDVAPTKSGRDFPDSTAPAVTGASATIFSSAVEIAVGVNQNCSMRARPISTASERVQQSVHPVSTHRSELENCTAPTGATS